MNTVKLNSSVNMIAHRGLSGIETENTCAAFIAAANRTYFGIECDIHVTIDGRFVVIHDEHTDRVAGDDINVEKSTYSLCRNICLNNKEDYGDINRFKKKRIDLKIPNLYEYVSICKKYKKTAIIELENKFSPNDIKKLLYEINEYDYLQNVIFISFSIENMIELRKLLPLQKLQYLTTKYNEEVLGLLDKYMLDLDIACGAINKLVVEEVHRHGHMINCWVCDDKNEALNFKDMGVDFITTNILE